MTERTSYSIPAYCKGQLVTLQQVLGLMDSRLLRWQLTELEAVALPDSVVHVVEMERAVRSADGGLRFSNQALAALGDQLQQVINCEVLGYRVEGGGAPEALVAIRAMDSTEWSIVVDESSISVDHSAQVLQCLGGE